jgi:endonuclease/exonuclease/phosphatase family metal-dependent hydrolase
MGKTLRKILKIVICIVLVCAAAFCALLLYLTATEYKPADKVKLKVESSESSGTGSAVKQGETLKYMTWNAGYGALGDNASFFMDGGDDVMTASESRVKSNIRHITEEIKSESPDFVFLQEVDRDSHRSYGIDEAATIKYGTQAKYSDFAYNYKVKFIPYPMPPIGRVNSGLLTLSSRKIESAVRYQLPCPFKWPVRLGNLKRCVVVNRTPVLTADGKDTGRELVSVNLHLEAYDSGEGKEKQTKMLSRILSREAKKGNYVIAGGDFNQTFSSVDSSMYKQYKGTWHCGELDEKWFDSSWDFVMDNTSPTCRSLDKPLKGADSKDFQYYMIDGFIVSSNVKVKKVTTKDLGFRYTDHEPVVMTVTLKK